MVRKRRAGVHSITWHMLEKGKRQGRQRGGDAVDERAAQMNGWMYIKLRIRWCILADDMDCCGMR